MVKLRYIGVFLKTLRDYRLSMLVWGSGLALLLGYYAWVYVDLFSGPDRQNLLKEYQSVFENFSFLTGKAYDLDTYGGFITAEFMTYLPITVGLFALLTGSALIRGEEERGSLDLVLAAPLSRLSLIVQKWIGMAVAMLVIYFFCFVGLLIGAGVNNLELSVAGTFLTCFDAFLASLVFGTLALLLSQFMSRKASAGWTGGLMAASFLMNTLGGSIKELNWLQPLSVFYYYSRSKPLAKSVGPDWASLLLLEFIVVVLLGLAIDFYLQRDHNGVARLLPFTGKTQAARLAKPVEPANWWLAKNFLFDFRHALPGVMIWGLGIALYEVMVLPYLDTIRNSMGDLLQSDFYKMLGFSNLVTNESLLSLMLFTFTTALCAAYSIIQVADWVEEESRGRLELLLIYPFSRWDWWLSRLLVALFSSALLVTISALGFSLTCWIANVPINTNRVAGAFFGEYVLCVIIIGAGFGLSAFIRRGAVMILAGLVIVSYLMELLHEALKLPGWLLDLSIFHQYNQPMVNDFNWLPQLVMLALGGFFALAGGFTFNRRDIAS